MKKSIIILFCSLFTVHCSLAQQYGWTDISSKLPDYPHDTTVINDGEDTIIAAIYDISFIDNDNGWVVTWHPFSDENAAILHTSDGGESWEVQTVERPCQTIHMVDENTGYAGSDGGMIFKTSDGGDNWIFHGITGAPITGMSFVPGSDTGYVCSYMSSSLQQITNESVNPIDLGDSGWWKSISAPSHDLIWIGVGISVYTFDEEGLTDQPITSATYNAIDFARDDLGWGVGYEGVKDRNHGVIAGCTGKNIDWVHLTYTDLPLNDVFALDEDHVWAVGYNGKIYYSENASQFDRDTITGDWWSDVVFIPQTCPLPDADFMTVFFTSPQNGYSGAGRNILLKYTQVNGVEEPGGMGAWGQGSVELWPNPTRGKFQITSTKHQINSKFQKSKNQIEILDLNGNVLEQWNSGTLEQWNPELDISHLPSGLYFVRISVSNSLIVKKIVKL